MHSYHCNLSEQSITSAIKRVEEYRDTIKDRCERLAIALCEVGVEDAKIRYLNADYHGDKNVSVRVEPYKNGYVVKASGQGVAFIEFGAGTRASGDTIAGETMTPGSWSQSDLGEKQFVPGSHEYWFFNGQCLDHENPNNVMMWTAIEMRESIEKIAKEVFGQ